MSIIHTKASAILAQLESLDRTLDPLGPSALAVPAPVVGSGTGASDPVAARIVETPDPDPISTVVCLMDDFANTILVGGVYPLAVTRSLRELGRLYPDPKARAPLEKLHNYFRRVFTQPRVRVSAAAGTVTIDGVTFSAIPQPACRIIQLLWQNEPDPVSQSRIREVVLGLKGDKTIRRQWPGLPWPVTWYIEHVPGRRGGLAFRLPEESVRDTISRDEPPEVDRV